MYRNFLFLIYLFFVPVLYADVSFENLTNTVKENFPSRYYGLAITDINNDRNFDLVVSNFEGANFYYSIEDNFSVTETLTVPLKEARESFEKQYLISQLKKFSGNISKTAKFIGMERSALHRKLKLLGVKDLN